MFHSFVDNKLRSLSDAKLWMTCGFSFIVASIMMPMLFQFYSHAVYATNFLFISWIPTFLGAEAMFHIFARNKWRGLHEGRDLQWAVFTDSITILLAICIASIAIVDCYPTMNSKTELTSDYAVCFPLQKTEWKAVATLDNFEMPLEDWISKHKSEIEWRIDESMIYNRSSGNPIGSYRLNADGSVDTSILLHLGYETWASSLGYTFGFLRGSTMLMAMWVYGLAVGKGWTVKVLTMKGLLKVSEYTYQMYLWHAIIITAWETITNKKKEKKWKKKGLIIPYKIKY